MTPTNDSPQARLAASRKALVRQMARDDGRADQDAPNGFHESGSAQTTDTHPDAQRSSTWQVFTHAVMAWWEHHPVQMAVDIGRPFLNSYARDKPVQLLGMAAAAGAALVLVKPWRLVSITGLALAAFKSTNLPGTLLSMMTGEKPRPDTRSQPTP